MASRSRLIVAGKKSKSHHDGVGGSGDGAAEAVTAAAMGNEVDSSDGVSADFPTTTSFSAAAASDSAASRLLLHPTRLAVKEEDSSSHQVRKLDTARGSKPASKQCGSLLNWQVTRLSDPEDPDLIQLYSLTLLDPQIRDL